VACGRDSVGSGPNGGLLSKAISNRVSQNKEDFLNR
jgi:hypothetical protein